MNPQPAPAAERPRLAITMGDPAGVGPELCLRILGDPDIAALCAPAVFGSTALLRRVAARSGLPMPTVAAVEDAGLLGRAAPGPALVEVETDADAVSPGVCSAGCGRAAYRCIERAIDAALRGEVAAVVTAPINKRSLSLAGVPYPGHTEIFAARTGTPRYCMMLAADALTVSFVTTHLPYAAVPAALSAGRILDVIELTADAVRRLKGRPPRLAVCGLNPHAGEGGLFGDEEARAIEPAIRLARERGIEVAGPLPPDTAFIPEVRARSDAVICHYHDQGHIPFKMLAFDEGVNVTLGLPIVRTSVDHGTAFDIAWQGVAHDSSLKHAIRLALRLAGSGNDKERTS